MDSQSKNCFRFDICAKHRTKRLCDYKDCHYSIKCDQNANEEDQYYRRSSKPFYTDVVVVGNGPSAIALSSFLSGYHPFYNASQQHPNNLLHDNLNRDGEKSILEKDIDKLSEGLEGRSSHGFSLLYDTLIRPNADLGEEIPSTLTWSHRPEKYVPHVVIGSGVVGGSWADFAPDVLTVSFGSWLDLPVYPFREWLEKEGANFATDLEMTTEASQEVVGRVPCAAIQQYFKDYIKYMELKERFFNFATVTSVYKEEENSGYVWHVRGTHDSVFFHFRTKKLVLATGANIPKFLNVPHESLSLVFHSYSELEVQLPQLMTKSMRTQPVLVVGDGLSAADAVVRLLVAGVPIIHSFRKTPRDPKHILSKLSRVLYPEYHTVYQLMTSTVSDELYEAFPASEVKSFFTDFTSGRLFAKLKRRSKMANGRSIEDEIVNLEIACAVILIGYEPNLSFIDDVERLMTNKIKNADSKKNTIAVNSHCRSVDDEDLYALGPLIGDNFVRYLVGGSMACAADILSQLVKSG